MEDLGPVNRVQLERVPHDLDAETEEVESGRARAGRLAPGVLQAFAGAWSQPQLANRRFFVVPMPCTKASRTWVQNGQGGRGDTSCGSALGMKLEA